MIAQASQRLTLPTVLIAMLGTSPGLHEIHARDDVPEEIAALTNPVELEESEVRYYQRQFKGKCAVCHGPDGAAKGAFAEAMVTAQMVPPADLTDPTFMATRTDGQLFYQILEGGGLLSPMPGFGPESDYAWTEEKVWHLVAYVRSLVRQPEVAAE